MKLERRHISVFVGVAVLAWWLVLLAQGTQVVWEHLRPFGMVVGILVILGWGLESGPVASGMAARLVREAARPSRHLAR